MVISVLYVDDEEALCDLATRFLNREPDISCVSVSSAKKALTSLQFEQYDILVTDYQMPGMDGLCLLKEISIRNIDIPVILFTGRGREEVAIEAFNLGATFYVQKGDPVTVQFQEPIHKIRIGVDRNRTRKKLIESEQRFRSFFTHTLLEVQFSMRMHELSKRMIICVVC
jgi:DNA-binding NtrC family response regulator